MTHIVRAVDPYEVFEGRDENPHTAEHSDQTERNGANQSTNEMPEGASPHQSDDADQASAAGANFREFVGQTYDEWVEARRAEKEERSRAFYAHRATVAAKRRRKTRRLMLATAAVLSLAVAIGASPVLLNEFAHFEVKETQTSHDGSRIVVASNQYEQYSSYYRIVPQEEAAQSSQAATNGASLTNLPAPTIAIAPTPKKLPQDVPKIIAASSTIAMAGIPELEPDEPAVAIERKTSPPAVANNTKVASLEPDLQLPKTEPDAMIAPKPDPALVDAASKLLKHGDRLMLLGDITSARALYQRALKFDQTAAAQKLGSTYDPLIFNRLGVRGLTPDAETAMKWYQSAARNGNTDARDAITSLQRAGIR